MSDAGIARHGTYMEPRVLLCPCTIDNITQTQPRQHTKSAIWCNAAIAQLWHHAMPVLLNSTVSDIPYLDVVLANPASFSDQLPFAVIVCRPARAPQKFASTYCLDLSVHHTLHIYRCSQTSAMQFAYSTACFPLHTKVRLATPTHSPTTYITICIKHTLVSM